MMSGCNEFVKQQLLDRTDLYRNGSEDSNYLEQLLQLQLLPDFIVDGLKLNATVNNIRYLKPSINLLEQPLKTLAHKNNFSAILEMALDSQKIGILWENVSQYSHEIRLLLAAHAQTPMAILRVLLYDDEAQIRTIAAQSLAQSLEGLEHLITYYATTSPPVISAIIAFYPQISPSLLTLMAQQVQLKNYWLVKYAIAQHPNTPISTLNILVLDSHPLVRDTAKIQLQRYSKSSVIPA